MQASSSRSALSVLSSAHLASPAVRALVPDAHRGEHHQPPPEAVREAPASSRLLLREVDQTETGEICIQ